MDLPQDMSVHFALMSCRVSWAWLSWVEEVSPAHNRPKILRLPKFWVTSFKIYEKSSEPFAKASPKAGPKFVRFVQTINLWAMSNSARTQVRSRIGNSKSLQLAVTVSGHMLVFALLVV
jgi:hypothetical protein